MAGEILKEIKFDNDHGVIKYYEPTLPRIMRVMPSMRSLIADGSITDADGNPQVSIDENDLLAGVMEKADKIISSIEHPEIQSFDQLIRSSVGLAPLMTIATEYFNLFVMANVGTGGDEEKKPVE